MEAKKVLVVDDEPILSGFLEEVLSRKGYIVQTASKKGEALQKIKADPPHILLTDMRIGKESGLDLISVAKETLPHMLIIVMTAFGSVENAVQAMKAGANDYILKPFTPDTLFKSLEKEQIENSNTSSLSEEKHTHLSSTSETMQNLYAKMEKAAATNASIFLSGESGVGKEVVASFIHAHSKRSSYPFVKVNCAALPDTLLEAELFGYEKGAFTGAQQKKVGRMEQAHGGTFLLDEITEMPISLQPKLLRAIQEKEIQHLGGTQSIPIDVRFISTSNRNLQQAIQTGIFREDLFFRLNVIHFHIPPLRERLDEIPHLVEMFIEQAVKEHHLPQKHLAKGVLTHLNSYTWPGNIRELKNAIERACVMSDKDVIEVEDILEPTFMPS